MLSTKGFAGRSDVGGEHEDEKCSEKEKLVGRFYHVVAGYVNSAAIRLSRKFYLPNIFTASS
jgi:hypothetical protein